MNLFPPSFLGVIAALWLTSLPLALADIHRQGGIVALFSDHNLDPAAIILHSMWLPRQGMAMVGARRWGCAAG